MNTNSGNSLLNLFNSSNNPDDDNPTNLESAEGQESLNKQNSATELRKKECKDSFNRFSSNSQLGSSSDVPLDFSVEMEALVRGSKTNLTLYELDETYRSATATYLSSRSWDPRTLLDFIPTPLRPHPPSVPKLGTLFGVFFPCLQNIVGIILFVRMPWIVGVAGIGLTLLMLAMSICCTILTTISMSAIATNGLVAAGGAYYMISRSLGKELGVSVGLLFFLSTAISTAVYVLGAVEILIDDISPYFGPAIDGNRSNQGRFFGTIILFIITCFVLLGTKITAKLSLFFLMGLILTNLSIFIGIFLSNRPDLPKNLILGFPGDFSGNFGANFGKPDVDGNTSSSNLDFFKLFSIFFPCVTGIMAGSNRSGNLAEPGKSIPQGTLSAIAASTILYFLHIVLIGTVVSGSFLRLKIPKYGLQVALLSWPHPMVTVVGCIFISIGAGMQCLSGASKIIQADEVFPWLSFFKHTNNGEPKRGIVLSFIIAECIVLIGNLDVVAPVCSMFFLICYASLNFSTGMLSLLKYPNWRPTWRFYHWSLSISGMILCLLYMFLINWIAAIIALLVVFILYKYVEYQGAEVEWGDGFGALNLHLAQRYLQALEGKSSNQVSNLVEKNWRPQIMCFLECEDNNTVSRKSNILNFLSHLRKGGGLTILTFVLSGSLFSKSSSKEIDEAYENLNFLMKEYKIQGFSKVIVSTDVLEGKLCALQAVGIGVLRPNTILLSYPTKWKQYSKKEMDAFVTFLRCMMICNYVMLIFKDSEIGSGYPNHKSMEPQNKIDVYWIMHDGGVLTLIPYLLKKHRIWRNATLRIFCVAQLEDNSIQMKKDLEMLLKRFRIKAEALVLEIHDYDISEFAYEKTIQMHKRNEILQELNLKRPHLTMSSTVQLGNDLSNANKPEIKRKAELMNTSVKLNQLIALHSSESQLIFCNLPAPVSKQTSSDYFEYLEALTTGLPPIVLIKGTGAKVISTFV